MNIPIKRGMLVRHQNHVFQVAEINERHTGKQKPTVHVLLRDLRDGRQVDRTLDELMPIEEVGHGYRELQYLYARGEVRVFMDGETFEEYELGESELQGCQAFLREGETYRALFCDERPVSISMPDAVALAVTDTAAPAHSQGTMSNIMKEATLENGLLVRVPLFIKRGDVIRVDTRTRSYGGKG